MKYPLPQLKILILEDNCHDAELTVRELRAAGISFASRRVETEDSFLEAIECFEPDVILSDYSLPQFDGLSALRLLKDRATDIPFILCTGASNEETAVECMKEGAVDYILKSTLKRLPSAVLNAIEKSNYRKAEQRANTALRASEQRLQQAQKMEAIGTLTGGVAHDFNNLLMAILGNTQLALRKLDQSNPAHARLIEIQKAANRAAELTRKLLAYSRRQHLERHTIDLNVHIAEIMQLLERVIGSNVAISADYADKLPAVYADPAQVEQVIMNLCINARDAMQKGGRLTIETRSVQLDEAYCGRFPYVQPGEFVRITVSDNGTGMDEETMLHIFEPFFTTKEQGKGTGLGLSMAYGIVKQHDGHVHVHSEVNVGTTFEIFLPEDQRAVETKYAPVPEVTMGGSEFILIAEDEEPLRMLAKDFLEDLGYRVMAAKDGQEAVDMFQANAEQIDLILFDVIMPRLGGLEAYARIVVTHPNIPLILMTGYSSETVQSPYIKQERPAGELTAPIIQKPYDIDRLARMVREVLDKSRKIEPSVASQMHINS